MAAVATVTVLALLVATRLAIAVMLAVAITLAFRLAMLASPEKPAFMTTSVMALAALVVTATDQPIKETHLALRSSPPAKGAPTARPVNAW